MSKLSKESTENIVDNLIARFTDRNQIHKRFDKILDAGHPLTHHAVMKMMVWGNSSHMSRLLDLPQMTNSNLELAQERINLRHHDRREELLDKLHKNFPRSGVGSLPQHNVNYKPRPNDE